MVESSYRQCWRLSWPAMVSGLSVPLLGLVDASVVGRLNEAEALGAVAIGAWVFDLLYWSFGFLRMGTTGLTACAYGADQQLELKAHLARPLLAAFALGLLILCVGLLTYDVVVPLLTGDDELPLIYDDKRTQIVIY